MKPLLLILFFYYSNILSIIGQNPKGYALLVGIKDITPQLKTQLLLQNIRLSPNATLGVGQDMESLTYMLDKSDFETSLVKSMLNAKKKDVEVSLKQIISKLGTNDLFVFYFSGHGIQLPDRPPIDEEKDDKLDEVLVLNDGLFYDDEIFKFFELAPTGCRILFIIDACNSGSINTLTTTIPTASRQRAKSIVQSAKRMDILDFSIKKSIHELEDHLDVKYQMIYMGAVRDGQNTQGGSNGSEFTKRLLAKYKLVLRGVLPKRDYKKTLESIDILPKPVYKESKNIQLRFCNSSPFQINS